MPSWSRYSVTSENIGIYDQIFEKVPGELQVKIVKNIKDRKGLTDAMVGA